MPKKADLKSPPAESVVAAVVVAAGQGLRFGGDKPKVLAPLAGRPLLYWSLAAFARHPLVAETVLVVPPGRGTEFLAALNLDFPVVLAEGGEYRTQSVASGLAATDPNATIVLVHDGARPLVTGPEIAEVIKLASRGGAAILAIPCQDTLKRITSSRRVDYTVNRADVWRAQTPQGFKRAVLVKALSSAEGDPERATDEAILAEWQGKIVLIACGSPKNIKITYPEDLLMAESLMAGSSPFNLRVGQGFDFHRFDPERPLWLGGVFLAGQPGLLGHSDADVLAHALIDALLGAAGMGDIGELFPPESELWRGASGAKLINLAAEKVRRAGYELINADLTLIGETPKIAPHREAMKIALAKALSEDPAKVSLKGTTTEGLGFAGRGEGLAASSVVLLVKGTQN
jgi:2-C-methyl-D-erythritol 4-phosphate cytidylyltransferase/2-C-methyl-D-erythritol 2,4-cyclodiphosphate synthase